MPLTVPLSDDIGYVLGGPEIPAAGVAIWHNI
jgi:hypothetical protein